MLKLYDLLKAEKTRLSSNLFTAMLAKNLQYVATEHELEGVPPLSFSANGEPLIKYEISGNMTSSGTPSSETPVYQSECGNLVESGNYSGKYAITVAINNNNNNIYLDEPLRKFGDNADICKSTGEVVRKVFKLVYDGTETGWGDEQTGTNTYFRITLPKAVAGGAGKLLCSHFVENTISASNELVGAYITSQNNFLRIRPDNVSTLSLADFKQWIADEYANGTPLTIWYVPTASWTESFTAPTISTVKGTNALSVDTTVQPSNVYIKYKG